MMKRAIKTVNKKMVIIRKPVATDQSAGMLCEAIINAMVIPPVPITGPNHSGPRSLIEIAMDDFPLYPIISSHFLKSF